MYRPDTPHEWQDDALCAQVATDCFFPERGDSVRDAKRICADCPVTSQCLELGMGFPFGVFGGLTPVERRRLRKGAA